MSELVTVTSLQLARLEQELNAFKTLRIPMLLGAVGVLIWGYCNALIWNAVIIAAFLVFFAFLGNFKPKLVEDIRQIKANRRVKVRATLHFSRLWWLTVESFTNEEERRSLPEVLYVDMHTHRNMFVRYFTEDELPLLANTNDLSPALMPIPNPTKFKEKDCEIVFDDAGERVLAAFTPLGMLRVTATSKAKYFG